MDIKLILDLHDQFLGRKLEELEHKISFLTTDQRKDEANLFKAKRNVYDIFRKMVTASRMEGDGSIKAYQRYLQSIPQNWYAAKEKAVKHGDVEKQTVEDMKLTALSEIIQHLKDTMGERGDSL